MTEDAPTPTPPTGPPARVLVRRPDEAPASRRFARIGSGALALGCFALLAVAAGLSPSAEGHGTHTDLGLADCGFLQTTGYPCATCGMTTSFAHAAEGQYVQSFLTQPFGMVLAVITSGVFWLALHSAVFGSRIGEAASQTLSTKVVWWAMGALVAAWVYKIVTMTG